jgi:thiol-disulfide isomerase/thioredoxin
MKTILDISIAVILIISGGCKTSNGSSESENTNVTKTETAIESKISNSSDESTNELTIDDDNKKVISEPIHLTKELFLEKVMNYEKNTEEWVFEGDLPCIIDFYADWCRPCKITSPILDELAKEYAGKIHFTK